MSPTDEKQDLPEGYGPCEFCGQDVLFLEGNDFGRCFNQIGDEDCGRMSKRPDERAAFKAA